VTVTLVDTLAPVLTVAAPPSLVYDNSPVTCHVTGTAVDSQSGVAWVRVSLIASNGTPIITDAPATLVGPPGANQQTNWSVDLRVPSSGSYTVSVRAADNAPPPPNITPVPSPYTAPVNVLAIPQPVVQITAPAPQPSDPPNQPIVIPGDATGASVTVSGTASASLSTIMVVEVSLDNGPYVAATPQASNDWSHWTKTIQIQAQGSHTITARVTNSAQNPASQHGTAQVAVTVGVAYRPQDVEDNISPRAYLGDLLHRFAIKRVLATSGSTSRALTVDNLTQQFF